MLIFLFQKGVDYDEEAEAQELAHMKALRELITPKKLNQPRPKARPRKRKISTSDKQERPVDEAGLEGTHLKKKKLNYVS